MRSPSPSRRGAFFYGQSAGNLGQSVAAVEVQAAAGPCTRSPGGEGVRRYRAGPLRSSGGRSAGTPLLARDGGGDGVGRRVAHPPRRHAGLSRVVQRAAQGVLRSAAAGRALTEG